MVLGPFSFLVPCHLSPSLSPAIALTSRLSSETYQWWLCVCSGQKKSPLEAARKRIGSLPPRYTATVAEREKERGPLSSSLFLGFVSPAYIAPWHRFQTPSDEMELTSSEINLPHNLDEMPSTPGERERPEKEEEEEKGSGDGPTSVHLLTLKA